MNYDQSGNNDYQGGMNADLDNLGGGERTPEIWVVTKVANMVALGAVILEEGLTISAVEVWMTSVATSAISE